jgi:hypothetical protein
MRLKIRRAGIAQLRDEISDGLEAVGDEVLRRAKTNAAAMFVDTSGATEASLRTNKTHSREWPKPAVFVSTATGAGFFVHEGTVDTPAHPFLSMALDSVRPDIPKIMRRRR